MEAAGVEPKRAGFLKLLMVHELLSKCLACRRFHPLFESSPIDASRLQSSPDLETLWRRREN